MQAETAALEPVDLEEADLTGKMHNQATQTGTRRRTAAEEPRNETIARGDDCGNGSHRKGAKHRMATGKPRVKRTLGHTKQPRSPTPNATTWRQKRGDRTRCWERMGGPGLRPARKRYGWKGVSAREKNSSEWTNCWLEIARQEYEEEEDRKAAEATNTEFDSESS